MEREVEMILAAPPSRVIRDEVMHRNRLLMIELLTAACDYAD